jgi:hypothetical protein
MKWQQRDLTSFKVSMVGIKLITVTVCSNERM